MNEVNYPPVAESLVAILTRLRAPDGCPWDREQTPLSLRGTLGEECAEAIDAIDRNDAENLCEELGDLLMNVVFQAVMAQEQGTFSWTDVCRGINEKMIRRHPHVFGTAHAATSQDVATLWQQVKSQEKNHAPGTSILSGIPQALSALERATKIQKKVAKVGFDWPDQTGIVAKIHEELNEVEQALAAERGAADHASDAVDEELGDLLFAVVNLIRFRKHDSAETLLRKANAKFIRRFQTLEQLADAPLDTLSAAEMDALWRQVKQAENHS